MSMLQWILHSPTSNEKIFWNKTTLDSLRPFSDLAKSAFKEGVSWFLSPAPEMIDPIQGERPPGHLVMAPIYLIKSHRVSGL